MAVIDTGGNVAGKANVDANFNAQVNPPGYTSGGVPRGGTDTEAGAVSMFSEIDAGTKNGVRNTLSPEVDLDYRLRVAHDNLLDQESLGFASQNTGKHTYTATTMAATSNAGTGILTNSGGITTVNTGLTFGTHAYFPVGGTQTIVCEQTVSFSAAPNANSVVDFGLFQRGATTAFAPGDGVYFRLTAAGLFGVTNRGGVETVSAVFPLSTGTGTFAYTIGTTYRFLIQSSNVATTFWINNFKYAEIVTPSGVGFPTASQALPWSFRHAIVGGAAGAVLQCTFMDYRVLARGPQYADDLGMVGNRAFGSYQGLSGGTVGQLVAGTVTAGSLVKPTAAVPLNASLAANLPNSLGGRIYEQLTGGLAVNVDGIFASYTVPVGSTTVPGRRLKVLGLMLNSFIQTVVAGGPVHTEFYIAFGHTADSLATTDSASMASGTTKAPRRIMCPALTQLVTAAQAANTFASQPGGTLMNFGDAAIWVNPGERIALVGNKTGTAATSGVIAHTYQFIYAWE